MAKTKKLPPGMFRRGTRYYGRVDGRKMSLGNDLATATMLLREKQIRATKKAHGHHDNDYPWADLKRSYLAWAKQHLKRPADQQKLIERFEKHVRPRTVDDVTPSKAVEYRAARLLQTAWEGRKGMTKTRPVSPRTINKEMSAIAGMLTYGVKAGLIESNPLKKLEQLPHGKKLKERRALSQSEYEALFAVSPAHLVPVWRLFIGSAIRRNELVTLTWDDIDFEAGEITIRAEVSKNGKARSISVHVETLAMLAELKATAGNRPHVFATQAGTPLKNNLLRQFYTYAQRAGIHDAVPGGSVDIHSLRGTAATLMLAGGGDPKSVQDILGHSTLDLTMRVYAKVTSAGKRNAIAAIPLGTVKTPDHILSAKCPTNVSHTSDRSQTVATAAIA